MQKENWKENNYDKRDLFIAIGQAANLAYTHDIEQEKYLERMRMVVDSILKLREEYTEDNSSELPL